MENCDKLIKRFTLSGQDHCIRELQQHELQEYQSIYTDLLAKHIDSCGEIIEGMDIQVINKLVTSNEDNITPMGLVNVSLENLAKILTLAKGWGIEWQLECKKCTGTHFKKLSRFKIMVDCQKDLFVSLAKEAGYRYN